MNDPSLIGEGHRVADCPSSEYFGQEGGSGESQNKGLVRAAPHATKRLVLSNCAWTLNMVPMG